MPRPLPVTAVSDSSPGSPVEHVLAVAEEGEVLVHQPAHQPLGLGGLGGQVGRHLGVEPVGHLDGPGAHLRPVLDGGAHVVEHRHQLGAQPLALGGVRLAVDLQVHPRLADGVVRPVLAALARGELGGRGVEHLDQRAGDVAADHDDRVHDQVDGAVRPALSRLVTESTRNGMSSATTSTTVCPTPVPVPVCQPWLSTAGVCTRTTAVPGTRSCGQLPVRQRGAGEVDRVAREQVLVRHVPVVAGEEPEQPLGAGTPLGGRRALQRLRPRVVGLRRRRRRGRRAHFALTPCVRCRSGNLRPTSSCAPGSLVPRAPVARRSPRVQTLRRSR